MSLQTLTIQEVPTKLPFVFRDGNKPYYPVWLTLEDAAEPVAVVMGTHEYEQMQRQKRQLYHMKLLYLQQWLERVEQQWDNQTIRAACIKAWQDNIESLWNIAPEPLKGLCAALILSIRQLHIDRLTTEQISALNYCVRLIRNSAPTDAEFGEAHHLLATSGIAPMVSLEEETIQSYLDEL